MLGLGMYLHAGSGCTIRTRDIIGIFDMDNAHGFFHHTEDAERNAEAESC